jgi:hypothetical protein
MDKTKKLRLLAIAASVTLLGGGLLFYFKAPATVFEDTEVEDVTAVSTNLADDIKLMWRTCPLKGNPGPVTVKVPKGSTASAIAAALRVFNTVKFVGMAKAEVIAKLGDPNTSSDSLYNFPFFPVHEKALVYRFDTGDGGWQFNLMLDESDKIQKVERLGIQ